MCSETGMAALSVSRDESAEWQLEAQSVSTEKHKIDREAVKTLAIAVGVREAARRLGLNVNRVLQWSKRDSWFPKRTIVPQPPTITKNDVISVIKPSTALATILSEDNQTTKLGLSRGAMKAAKVFGRLPGASVIRRSEDFSRIVNSASKIHAWEAVQPGSGALQLNLLSGQTVVQIGNP